MKRWLAAIGISLALSGCGGDGETTESTGVSTSPSAHTNGSSSRPGRVQFASSSLAIPENANNAAVTITRTDGSAGAITVQVRSRAGTATAGADFTAVNTTVTFAAGDTAAKTVSVVIVDDAVDEVDETFNLELAVPSGGAVLGSATETLLTIADDDLSAPATAPRAALTAKYKNLRIDWTASSGATTYRVLKDPGNGQLERIAEVSGADRFLDFAVVVHKEDWSRLAFVVEACNAAGCVRSTPVSAAGLSTPLIGYLKAPTPRGFAEFGSAVAFSGDGNTLVVGAEESLHVYERSGSAWSAPRIINPPGGFSFLETFALSEDGSTLAVSSRFDDTVVANSGAVYVYRRDGSGNWSTPDVLKASNPGINDDFGSAIALSTTGQVLAVGASNEDSDAAGVGGAQNENRTDSGAVYVFTRSNGTWSAPTYVKSPSPRPDGGFGAALAVSGEGRVLAVGETASGCPALLCTDLTGTAYVYSMDAWTTPAKVIKPPVSSARDDFGRAVALSRDGTMLVVGAPDEDGGGIGVGGDPISDCAALQPTNCAQNSGAAYVYVAGSSGWSSPAYLKASNTGVFDRFGSALAVSANGNTIAVGAIFERGLGVGVSAEADDLASGAGAVYVFERADASSWSRPVYVKATNTKRFAQFGEAVALSGDGALLAVGVRLEDGAVPGLNGDPWDDCEKPDIEQQNCAVSSGAVYLY
jgi:trimeric autotransporter adhesin